MIAVAGGGKGTAKVESWRLEKRDAASGEIFEIIEGGDGKPTRATHVAPGQPPESYYQGEKSDEIGT